MSDLISRQAAIDALEREKSLVERPITETRWFDFGLGKAQDVLSELPSAQPERTCVNCGRTANNGGWYADGRTRCPIEEHYALPEIIRCKDCEYGEQDEVERWFCRSLGCQIGNEDGSGYCADAERRTDD